MSAPESALADCTVTQGGGVTCNASTVTTPATLLDAGGLPSTTTSDQIIQFDNGTPITASVNAVTMSGYGMELLQTGATSGTIDLINNAGSLITSDPGNVTAAVTLVGNSGKITYSGSGSVTGSDDDGIYASNTGTGQISIVTTGIIAAGDNSGGDDYGIYTTAQNGATTINLDHGGTIEGATTGGLADGAGIYSRSVGGNVTITADDIGADGTDRAYTGIDAAITGNASGQLSVTGVGTIYATQTGISAQNNNLGGITVNLNSGSTIDIARGVATVGEYVRDTGSSGGITVTNQAGSLIDPDTGVDSQITNNANNGNVVVDQEGTVTGNVTGIIAGTNGNGNIHVYGAGDVTGGSGVYFLNTATPVSANNVGIVAIQNGTAGTVTIEGSGTTSATAAIIGEITNASNASAIVIDRSGAIGVTGAGGFGVLATTQGLGTVTVQDTGAIAGSGGGTVAFGIDAVGSGGSVLVKDVSDITADATDGYGISASTIGLGTVTVSGTGAITAAGNGISATTSGGGKVTVTGTGAIIADSDSSTVGTGIIATSVGGAITVTPGSTVAGANGIDAETNSNGTVTVTTGGDVTATTGYGVKTVAQDGATLVTANVGGIQGNTFGVESTSDDGKITITGSKTYTGGSGPAISATMNGPTGTGAGNDGILISGTGNTSTTGAGDGIDASITSAGNHSNIDITRSGTVTAGANGILATTLGDGNVTVTNTGNVSGTTGTGIDAESRGGNIIVTPSGTVSDANGIYGSTNASGTVTIATAFGAAGNVTGTGGFGIASNAENGNTYITNNATTVQGTTYAVNAAASGTGGISVIGAGDYTGGSAGGIYAQIIGTGPSGASGVGPGGTNGIFISGSGKTTTTDGDAIHAHEAGGTASILVNRTGLVTVTDTVGGGDGIYAVTAGSGNVTVTGVTGVSAGHGVSAIGIDAESNGGDVTVTPAGTVVGGNGIEAATNGAGDVLVQTIATSAGNVTGLDGFGVLTVSENGNTIVNNKAAQISGTTWADDSTSTGTGTLTIEGAGDYAGGTGGGISAVMTGLGPASGNTGVHITGTGNTSATIGSGIFANISNPGNESDIVVDRSGTVTVSGGIAGGYGIYAHTSGDGNVLIHDVSNVQGGTGVSAGGIDAASNGGDVTVDLSTPLLNSATVSGGNGISAVTTNGGDVTVTTYTGAAGNVTGLLGYGVNTTSVNGDTVVTNKAATISGATWADQSNVSGFGTIRITDSGVAGNGNFVGGSAGGIYAYTNGAGPGALSGIGPDSDAAIWISGSGNTSGTGGTGIFAEIDSSLNANSILIDRTGTVTDAGGNGIYAAITSGGTGNVTVTGTGAVIANNTTGTGITALAQTGDVTVTPSSTVYGSAGIDAETGGTGTVTVTTLGDITGTVGDGIHAASVNGDINVTTAAGTLVAGDFGGAGTGDGIDARASGSGNVHVIANSDVSGDPGIIVTSATGNAWATANGTITGLLQGVYAEVTSGLATSFVLVDGTGNVTGGTTGIYANNNGSGNTTVTGGGNTIGNGGDGIYAHAVAGDVLVDRDGTVTAWGNGIDARSTGGGDVTVDGVNDVLANTGAGSAVGIVAYASGGNGDVSVTPDGTVSGYIGISTSALGTGTITVTTASNAAGNVTGTGAAGIESSAANGDTTITNNAALVSGATYGDYSTSSGTGAITIDGSGTYHGTANAGIYAQESGGGPAAGNNGIHITGSGNTETSTGIGIVAYISSGSNDSDILIDRTGTVTVGATGGNGINATTNGGGNISVDGVGDVLAGTAGSTTGIYAEAFGGGDVQVTPDGTVTGSYDGIYARAHDAGDVTVATALNAGGNVTGTAHNGIYAHSHDGDVSVTNNAATVQGGVNGVFAVTTGLGTITVDGGGTYAGGTGDGINARMYGNGPASGTGIHIGGSGNATTNTGIGIYALINSSSNASDIVIDRTGTVTVGSGGGDGVYALTNGTGDVSVTHTGAVTAGIGLGDTGIYAIASGGDVTVEPYSTVYGGGMGIDAETILTGTVTVTTHGDITGNTDDGIHARTADGDIHVTTAAGTKVWGSKDSGTGDGIDARASGAGNVIVDSEGAVEGDPGEILSSATGNVDLTENGSVTGDVGRGIDAQVTSSGATSYVKVTGAGNVLGATDGIYAKNAGHGNTTVSGGGNAEGDNGDGIDAYTVAGNVLIDRTGTATGSKNGIDAVSNGGGSVTVTGTGNVLGDIGGSGYYGIHAVASSGNGNVSVTPAGTVDGDTGIYASADGLGTVTVTTATNSISTTGNVTGHEFDGIDAYAHDGNIDVVNNAATVSGVATGVYAQTNGIGAITIDGPGTYHGGTGDGIDARVYGTSTTNPVGPVLDLTNAIWITGSGNASTTSGTGINAYIDSSLNTANIKIDRTGTVTVGAGGGDGIDAVTNGAGKVTVINTGAVMAGTVANTIGIKATSQGGAVDVEPSSSVDGHAMGIDAETNANGTVTVVAHGNITGNTDDGIHARSVNGIITVTTDSLATVTGDASHTSHTAGVGDGIDAQASGSGSVHVTANGAVYGDPAIIVTSATGNAWATANAITNGLTYGVYAQVTGSAAASFVLVDGTGAVTGGTTGIYAENDGHGTTTVSGSNTTQGNNGDGIDAYAKDGAVLVNRTGTVTASEVGIDAETSAGGSVTVTNVGNVNANTGAGGYIGIIAIQAGGNGFVSVTPAGTVSGATGIYAEAAGTGAVTVTTASGAAGNVSGTVGNGIDAFAFDGNISITNSATTVHGAYQGVYAESDGLGTITVTGTGAYTGGTGNGIDAEMLGVGPAAGNNGITISGTGNTATTSGYGVFAYIDNVLNASNISITRSGTVTVGAAGLDGVHATTIGGGNISVTGTGNVVAGTGATGIYASTSGGNGNVSIATNGTIAGARGVYASAVGNGTITVTVTKATAGNAGNGIETSAVNGATHVNVNSATTTGSTTGKAGVNESASGSGGLFLTVASGATVTGGTTASGVKMSQTGTGSNSITNNGTITGAGTTANPVISVGTTASGTSTITNNANATIQSTNGTANNKPADMAVLSSTTTGSDSIVNHGTLNGEIKLSNATNSMNNSGTWNVRDNTGASTLAAAFGSGGNNTLTNSGTINAGNALAAATSTFTGIQTITNSSVINAGLFGTSDVTTFDASGNVQSVTNTGTINVHGTLNFVGDASFNNAGGIIDMRTSGSATTDVTGLNVTASGNTYSPGVAYNFAGGTNSRLGLDTFVGALSSAGSTVPSDRLLISGTATLTTGILLNDVNAGSGSYNPVGITLVGVNGASTDAFYLQSLASTSPYDALETGYGPMGAVKKGFWVYPLLQSTHAEATANGLTGASSSEYRLYGLPDVEAYQLPLAITGAQNIWYETAAGWDERQEEARRYWDVYADRRSKDTGKSADIWLKMTGSWTKRDVMHDQSVLVPAASVLDPVNTDFKQDVGSIQLGVDGQVSGTRDGAFVLGASVGYVASTLDFSNTNNTFTYTGGIIDATADYYNGPWFVDVLAKVDLLQTQLKFNSLAPFGYVNKTVNTNTYGALSSAGYHFVIDRDHSGHTYLEPLITLSYTQSNLDKLSELGTTVNFDNGETFRGAIGARLGTLMGQKTSFYLDGSLTAQYWDEFTNSTDVILSTMGPALELDDKGRQKGFGSFTGMLDIADGDSGWSGFLNGGAKFNSQFTTLELKGGVRYQW